MTLVRFTAPARFTIPVPVVPAVTGVEGTRMRAGPNAASEPTVLEKLLLTVICGSTPAFGVLIESDGAAAALPVK